MIGRIIHRTDRKLREKPAMLLSYALVAALVFLGAILAAPKEPLSTMGDPPCVNPEMDYTTATNAARENGLVYIGRSQDGERRYWDNNTRAVGFILHVTAGCITGIE
jgi:hypothetical protein